MLFLFFFKMLTLAWLPSPDHAFYLAVIQVDHQDGGEQATVTVKVFMDDLQDALRNFLSDRFVLSPVEDCCEKNFELAGSYFSEHLVCQLDEQPLSLLLRECRTEGDVFLLQFDMPCPVTWRELTIKADLFMEIYPAQSNVVSILHGSERRYLRLKKGQATGVVRF